MYFGVIMYPGFNDVSWCPRDIASVSIAVEDRFTIVKIVFNMGLSPVRAARVGAGYSDQLPTMFR